MRKGLSLVLAIVLMFTLLAGCGNSGTEENKEVVQSTANDGGETTEATDETNSDDVTEDIKEATIDIFQNKSEVAQQLDAAAARYMELNPHITINIETVQGNEYNTALKAKMLVEDTVEIMALSANDIANNYTEFLEDLNGEPWIENVAEGLLNDAILDGTVVGLPVNIEGYGIAYNKSIFEDAGIDTSTLTTYEAIDNAFIELQQKIDDGELSDKYPQLEAVFEYAAKEAWVMGLHTLNIAMANEYASAKDTLAADEIELIYASELNKLFDLLTNYTSSRDDLSRLLAVDYSTQVGGGLAIERVAAIQQGNWIGPEVRSIAPDVYENMDFLPLPLVGVKEDSIAVGVPAYWCVNKNSNDVDKSAAKDFMTWLYQSEEGKKIVVQELGYIPAFVNYDGIEITDSLSASIIRYVSEGKIMPWVFGGFPSGYEAQSASRIQAYISGLTTWDECVEALKSDWIELKK